MADNRDLTRGVPDMPAVGHRETLVARVAALQFAVDRVAELRAVHNGAAVRHAPVLSLLLTEAQAALTAHDTLMGKAGR